MLAQGESFQWDIIGASSGAGNNLGYYNFSRNPEGMQMTDFRGYSSAAVMYYAAGELVEDNTEQYLLTWEGTMGPRVASRTGFAPIRPSIPRGAAVEAVRW